MPPKIDPAVFDQVSNELYGNQWLEVDYKNVAGKRTANRAMPLGLAQRWPRVYLACHFYGYNNESSLALHRILSARASTLTFERLKDLNLRQYDDD